MISELVITDPDGTGSEKPNVNVHGSWAYAPAGGEAFRTGKYFHPDGDPITLTSSLGPNPTDLGGGNWEWKAQNLPIQTTYVFITATDTSGRKDQAVFRLKIGPPDDGSDIGDPHIRTVDGKYYDFQAVGEFTLLRDPEGFEVQVRQTPVPAATPITDSYSGLTSCVSVNTAVAARVGSHRIAYQPSLYNRRLLQFFLDGEPAELSARGLDLGGARVTAYPAGAGATGIRVDYENGAVLTITPYFWSSYNIWLLNVSVSRTAADEGIMGRILSHSWLPTLPSGATVGRKPASLHKRYVALYHTFANAWRVTKESSLFVYAPGKSTVTFTDTGWPAEKTPCKLKARFRIPGAQPSPSNITPAMAERICRPVTVDDLHRGCVFDVATTGDRSLVKMYLEAQELRLRGTAVQITTDKRRSKPGEAVVVTANVAAVHRDALQPRGKASLFVDGAEACPAVEIDDRGRARFTVRGLKAGEHWLRGVYVGGGGKRDYHSSSSPNRLHTVGRDDDYQHQREDQLLEHKIEVPEGPARRRRKSPSTSRRRGSSSTS